MISLYPFQARGLEEGRALYRSGRRAVCFVGPTGMGKTVLASEAALGAVQRGTRVVCFVHRRELLLQMARKIAARGLAVGYLGKNANAPVQVRSVQEVLVSGEVPEAELAIFDEAHHYVSDDWIRVPRAYLAQPRTRLMGLTATPERDDGRGLGGEGGIFDGLVVVAQVRELVELNSREPAQGVTPIEVHDPTDPATKLAQAPVDAYLALASGRSAVVFAPNVLSAHAFCDGFTSKGVAAAVVHGELGTLDRDGALSRFAAGDLRVLVNVAVLTEGWDAPICDVVMLGRKIGSTSLYYQCVGRGRRPYPGKASAMLIDLAGNVEIHGHPDNDLVYSLDGVGCARSDGATLERPRFCRVCRRELPRDAVLPGDDGAPFMLCGHKRDCPKEAHCPDCGEPLSKVRVPTPEEIELKRVVRDEQRKRAPLEGRAKALRTLYVDGLRTGKARGSAHHAYRGLFGQFPPADVRVPAWREAVETVAGEKGDAWMPPEDERLKVG